MTQSDSTNRSIADFSDSNYTASLALFADVAFSRPPASNRSSDRKTGQDERTTFADLSLSVSDPVTAVSPVLSVTDKKELTNAIASLGSEDFNTRDKASATLDKYGADAVSYLKEPLLKALASDDAEVRRRTAEFLERRYLQYVDVPFAVAAADSKERLDANNFRVKDLAQLVRLLAVDGKTAAARTSEITDLIDIYGKHESAPERVASLRQQLDDYKNINDTKKAIERVASTVDTLTIEENDTNNSVNAIKYAKNLRTLILLSPHLTDAAFASVKDLKQLKTLCLGPSATDATLANVRTLTSLENLSFCKSTAVTDAGMKSLKLLPNLAQLHIVDTPLTDRGLKELSGLTKLKTLSLVGPAVTNEWLGSLKAMENLGTLSLSRSSVSAIGIEKLQNLPGLKSLDLTESIEIDDDAVGHLSRMKELMILHVAKTSIHRNQVRLLREAIPGCLVVGDGGILK